MITIILLILVLIISSLVLYFKNNKTKRPAPKPPAPKPQAPKPPAPKPPEPKPPAPKPPVQPDQQKTTLSTSPLVSKSISPIQVVPTNDAVKEAAAKQAAAERVAKEEAAKKESEAKAAAAQALLAKIAKEEADKVLENTPLTETVMISPDTWGFVNHKTKIQSLCSLRITINGSGTDYRVSVPTNKWIEPKNVEYILGGVVGSSGGLKSLEQLINRSNFSNGQYLYTNPTTPNYTNIVLPPSAEQSKYDLSFYFGGFNYGAKRFWTDPWYIIAPNGISMTITGFPTVRSTGTGFDLEKTILEAKEAANKAAKAAADKAAADKAAADKAAAEKAAADKAAADKAAADKAAADKAAADKAAADKAAADKAAADKAAADKAAANKVIEALAAADKIAANIKIGQSMEILPQAPPGYGNVCFWRDYRDVNEYLVKNGIKILLNTAQRAGGASVIQLPLDSNGYIIFNGFSVINDYKETGPIIFNPPIKYSPGNFNIMNVKLHWATWIYEVKYLNSEKIVNNPNFWVYYRNYPIYIRIYGPDLKFTIYTLQNEIKTITGIVKSG